MKAERLALTEAQHIAESVTGPVQWNGAEGFIECPGLHQHTSGNNVTDCKVVCERIGSLAPGVYCFHTSCADEVNSMSREVRSRLGRRLPSTAPRRFTMPRPAPKKAEFCPRTLERIAMKLDGANEAYFAARSRKRVDNGTPANFLHELGQQGERFIVFSIYKSQGQAVWLHSGHPFDARALDRFRAGAPHGVWFLSNPVTGKYSDTGKVYPKGHPREGKPHFSRRWEGSVTAWRYMVLESDKASAAHWLAVLAQMPLPIAAVYTSGGRSIHALVRLDAESKDDWDAKAERMKPSLVTIGADPGALSAVRLTRLPFCERVEKGQLQRLLYLNGAPDGTPICEQEAQ